MRLSFVFFILALMAFFMDSAQFSNPGFDVGNPFFLVFTVVAVATLVGSKIASPKIASVST
jgi:hypothetical protein